MQLNFQQLKADIFQYLSSKRHLVVATSAADRVTARTVSYVVLGEVIAFQTDTTFLKFEQIKANPHVALCIDHIQIEGTAHMTGHPYDLENSLFLRQFEKTHPGSFEQYSKMVNETVIEVLPSFITLWGYENRKPYRDFLDLQRKTAYREYYDISTVRKNLPISAD